MNSLHSDPHHLPYDDANKPAYPQIPVEVSHPTNWRRIAGIFVYVLIIVLLVNFTFYAYLQTLDAASRTQSLVGIKWHILQDLNAPVDWLILGDSSANQGVIPDLLNEQLGGAVVNLATNGNLGLVNEVWMLESYLTRFGAPEGVIIVHTYDTFARDVDLDVMLDMPLPLGYWRELIPPLDVSVQHQLRHVFERYFPLISRPRTLEIVLQTLFPNTRQLTLQNSGYMRGDTPNPARVEQDFSFHVESLEHRVFEVSPINQRAMDRLLALMEQYHFPVYYKLGPVYDRLYENERYNTHWHRLETWLKSYESNNSQFCYLPEPVPISINQLQNTDHVTYEAAIRYTNVLIDEIQTCPSS